MKTIIMVSGNANRGKTGSIKCLERMLSLKEPMHVNTGTKGKQLPKPQNEQEAVCAGVYTLDNGRSIKAGLISMGDYSSLVKNALFNMQEVYGDLDVIVVATRFGGYFLQHVQEFAEKYGYNVMQTANYVAIHTVDSDVASAYDYYNSLFAESLLNLIKTLNHEEN